MVMGPDSRSSAAAADGHEDAIAALVRSDDWMMEVLRAAAKLGLPDWWIGAGFLRNRVWDALSGRPGEHLGDIDLVYFDRADTRAETDWSFEDDVNRHFPLARWEVRNQARMHTVDGFAPYTSTADGIAHWVETATCVGVRLREDELEFLFCHGTADLMNIVARPIPAFRTPDLLPVFHRRIESKKWRSRWPNLTVIEG